jgi:hypothetical protein
LLRRGFANESIGAGELILRAIGPTAVALETSFGNAEHPSQCGRFQGLRHEFIEASLQAKAPVIGHASACETDQPRVRAGVVGAKMPDVCFLAAKDVRLNFSYGSWAAGHRHSLNDRCQSVPDVRSATLNDR